ncbi:MAG: bifunctional folylpolyglutamate synthase/dihydrofolate synthase, partial [Parvibaculum sp.]|nr:bifunctional folylpolyglutamate synthase/dihydrofolate synthase [Parvibaculum sp.]
FLGDTIALIAAEKAGILKRGAPAIIGPQPDEARVAIEMAAEKTGTKLFIHGQDFTAHEEAGALVYQDEVGLLDLPLPRLAGRHQIDNAGIAICALRQSGILPLDRAAIADGLTHADWPARLQRLTRGPLIELLPKDSDIWLDGGHNPAAGRAVAETMADLAARDPKPLVLVAGMLDTKDAAGFFAPFAGLAAHVETVTIPDAPTSLPAEKLAEAARAAGLNATPAVSLESAVARTVVDAGRASPRVLIGGSLYLAGHILRDHA